MSPHASEGSPPDPPAPSDVLRAGGTARFDPERVIDWFLPSVGLLGLGLVAWLVYIYWQ
jgi:hypothetical protein